MKEPYPGSDEALDLGCLCPVIENGHGKGFFGNGGMFGWAVNGDCPLHGSRDSQKGR